MPHCQIFPCNSHLVLRVVGMIAQQPVPGECRASPPSPTCGVLSQVIPVQLLLQVREGTGREGRGIGWKMTSSHMGLRDNHLTRLKSFTPIDSRSSLFAFELQFCTTTYAPPLFSYPGPPPPPPPPPPPLPQAKFITLTNGVSLLERVSLCQGWTLQGVPLYMVFHNN